MFRTYRTAYSLHIGLYVLTMQFCMSVICPAAYFIHIVLYIPYISTGSHAAALRLLRDLAATSLIRFVPETSAGAAGRGSVSEDDMVTARLNEIYAHENSSLDPAVMAAQTEVLAGEDW